MGNQNNPTVGRMAQLPPLPRQKLPTLPELPEIKYSKSPPVPNSKYQGLGNGMNISLIPPPGSTKGAQ